MNTLIIPSSARKRVFSTWIWDNNDLCEETLSGAGTTHVTNGILVQQGPSAARIELSADLNYQPPAEPMENTILPFVLPPGKKGPKPLQVDVVVILAKSPELLMETAKEDFLWTVVRQQPVVGLFTVDDRAAQVIPSWTGYNASIRDTVPTPNTIGFLQPVNESPTEIPAMYTVMKRSQYFARLLELPEVDCVYDQACYAKASHIMWASPDEFGNVVNRLGAFHTIPVFISCIFKMYGDAGLIDVIPESGIVASGSLQGVVTGHHYNRAVRTLKTVYDALSRFLWQSFGDNLDKPDVDNPVDIDMNLIQEQVLDIRECLEKDTVEVVLLSESFNKLFTLFIEFKQSKEKGPMFLFWGNFLRMVELLLAFIRAAREGNWELHLAAFREMLPFFFTFNHYNYARYRAYYFCTMRTIANKHPMVHRQLTHGQFGVQLSNKNPFAKIPEDQSIEETINKSSKIPGGIVGKSRNPEAVGRWIETTADRSQITENIRRYAGISDECKLLHKEAGPSRIKTDERDVRQVVEVIASMLNPFSPSDKLTSISTGITAEEKTEKFLFSAQETGDQLCEEFVKRRLIKSEASESAELSIFDTIAKQKTQTFSTQTAEHQIKVAGRDFIIKADRTFFCKLVFIARSREFDLFEAFSHELGPIPWALATPHGTLYKSDNSKLLQDLEKDIPAIQCPANVALVIDTFATIQKLKPTPNNRKPSTFTEVAQSVLSSACKAIVPQPVRIDLVVDNYIPLSIKNTERARRSKVPGIRYVITSGAQKAPNDWSNFMLNSENKQDLPDFLVNEWSKDGGSYSDTIKDTSPFVCHGEECHRLKVNENSMLKDAVPTLTCSAEEADTRLLLHCKHIAETGNFGAIVLKTSDTDVVVIAVHFQHEIGIPLIINRQATQKRWKFIDIPAICKKQGEEVGKALPGMQAFSGCDTNSSFCGKGKKTFFKLMKKDADFMSAMIDLGESLDISTDLLAKCEKSLCCIYDEPNAISVNEVRYRKLSKAAEAHNIPPTQDALTLHIRRANYQCYIWKNALNSKFKAPSPNGHCWIVEGNKIKILWITKDPAPKALLQMVSCKTCKKCDTRRCSCKNKGFPCTDACGCLAADCENSEDTGRYIEAGDEQDAE